MGVPTHKDVPLGMREDVGFIENFESKVLICPMSGCHLWTPPAAHPFGYGSISFRGRQYGAHRVAWWLYRGDHIPEYVAHRCDVPACVNPDHLFLATALENMRDCWSKGRHPNVLENPDRPRRRGVPVAPYEPVSVELVWMDLL